MDRSVVLGVRRAVELRRAGARRADGRRQAVPGRDAGPCRRRDRRPGHLRGAAGAWGGENPWGLPFFLLTHRPQDEPADGNFTFVDGLDEAVRRAREEAGEKDVFFMGGADVIRQALRAALVEELTITIAPVVLGSGKRLFEGFDRSMTLEHVRVLQSPFATHVTYRVVR